MTTDNYDNVSNLILERLRRMEERFDRLDEKADMTNAQLRILAQHMAGLMGSEALNNERFASIEARLDRIDRRLDLREA